MLCLCTATVWIIYTIFKFEIETSWVLLFAFVTQTVREVSSTGWLFVHTLVRLGTPGSYLHMSHEYLHREYYCFVPEIIAVRTKFRHVDAYTNLEDIFYAIPKDCFIRVVDVKCDGICGFKALDFQLFGIRRCFGKQKEMKDTMIKYKEHCNYFGSYHEYG